MIGNPNVLHPTLEICMKVLVAQAASEGLTQSRLRLARTGKLGQAEARRLVEKGITGRLAEYADLADNYNLAHEHRSLFMKIKHFARQIEVYAAADEADSRAEHPLMGLSHLNNLLCDFRTVSGPLVGYGEIDAVIQPILTLANAPHLFRDSPLRKVA
ncbi:MAG: hypothetical protein EOM26_03695 [Alphaproteobacteria bacterium]|nr:hypothetical protein [Alphaproteobacteria bacterium]